MIINIKKVGNHWYPCIQHDSDWNISFCRNAERYFNFVSKPRILYPDDLKIELEDVGLSIDAYNVIYFYEEDITRYLTTDDYFDIRFKVNGITFTISSDLYQLLENQYQFNFHKESYKIHIY